MEQNREIFQKRMEEISKQCERNPNDIAIAFENAEKLFQLGNFAKSKEILKPLLAKENPLPQIIYLSAQIEYLNGNYMEAEKLYRTLINQFPKFKEKAERGLGYVYYQTNQYSKAQDLSSASDSFDSIGEMMRSFGDRKPYQVKWLGSNKVVIPFLATNPLPVIQAEIEGQLYNFLIDTGAADIILDSSLAASLEIKTVASFVGTFAGGATTNVDWGILESITLNGTKIESVPVNILPSETIVAMSALFNNEFVLSGVIGVGVFKQFLATMDYPENQLILNPRDGRNELIVKNAIETPFVLAWMNLIISKGEINGKEVDVFLDSGLAMDVATLLPNDTINYTNISIASSENIEGFGGGGVTEMQIGHFNIDTFKLGTLPEVMNISGLSGVFPVRYYFDENIGFFIDSLISHNFLRDYKWTIDFDSMKMIFS